ncbi:hypothetical protein BJV77DRAFT_636054 [Russula vinacea]|nr:hypothetical protein BJV77DRAFT_636054 [Russula vinacea]
MQSPVSSPLAPRTVRYAVQSSDVLSYNRVNVSEEKSERVIWYKERTLTDDEIIEHVVDNANSTVLWEIHRPLRGWYIRLRSPRFPRNVLSLLFLFLQARRIILPARSSSPALRTSHQGPIHNHPQLNLFVASPTWGVVSHLHDSDVTLTDEPRGQFSPTHTYPPAPTPPRTVVRHHLQAPYTKSLTILLNHVLWSPIHILTTHPWCCHPASEGLFSRALRTLKNNTPASANSFTLSPLPDGPPPTSADNHHHHHHHSPPQWISTSADFEDTTPCFLLVIDGRF